MASPDTTKSNDQLISLLENELKSSDNRYLNVRSQLLQALTSNAQLLEYTQYIEDQLTFFKNNIALNEKKAEILASGHILPDSPDDEPVMDAQTSSNVQVIATLSESSGSSTDNFENLKMYRQLATALSMDNLAMGPFLSALQSVLSLDSASIYSLFKSTETVQCESSTLSDLCSNTLGLSSTKQIFLREIMKSKRSFQTATACLEPLFNGKQEMIGVLELECKIGEENTNLNLKPMLNLSRNMASILLSAVLVEREFEDSNLHKEALLELAKVVGAANARSSNGYRRNGSSHGNNIESFIEKVRKTVYKSVKCDKVAVFIADEIRQELWCNASDDVAGIRLPLNKGIVGYTVTTGESLNITDAYEDARFNPEVDRKTSYVTKSILCVPIKYNDKIIGAMECINKEKGACFSSADVLLLNKMAQETAPSLQNKFMESALRIISQGLQDSSSRDYLLQFMHLDEAETEAKDKRRSWHDKRESRIFSSAKSNSNHSLKGLPHGVVSEAVSEAATSIAPKLLVEHPRKGPAMFAATTVCTWDFDYFVLIEDDYATAIPMAVYMLADLGLLEKFSIPETTLYAFLKSVKSHYWANPYHNFLHAFSVMHICYLLIKETSICHHFDDLDVLTMFIAALCHDLEHPGLTNAFQVNSGSSLALMYNDRSVLENHHAHIASCILRDPKTAILADSTLDIEERTKARKAMISIILHTDMSYHQDIVTQLLQFGDRRCSQMLDTDIADNELDAHSVDGSLDSLEDDRLFLSQTVVHLGDISNPVMRWDQSHQWSLRVIEEFVAQSKREKKEALKVSMAFIKDTTPESVSKVQLSFIDYVAKPLWKNAQIIAPELHHRIVVLEDNRRRWVNYALNGGNADTVNVVNAKELTDVIECAEEEEDQLEQEKKLYIE